jgi:hypothetical protein
MPLVAPKGRRARWWLHKLTRGRVGKANLMTSAKVRTRSALSDRRVRRIKVRRLRVAERLGIERLAMPGLQGLDRRLIERVRNARNHTFIEFGANDGIQQSNTYVLERDHGWTGVLVEPVAQLAAECGVNRPQAVSVCAAVVEPSAAGTALAFDYFDLMTKRSESGSWRAVGITLSTLLDELLGGTVGLVVIDVEGGELRALEGLDLSRHRPEFFLVETANPDLVSSYLGDAYGEPLPLSYHDYLFESS